MRKFPDILLKLNFWILILIAAQVAAIIFLCLYIPSVLPVVAALALIWLLSAISATVLFTRAGAPEVKCVWFVVIAAVPVAGALVYLLASIKSKPCGVLTVKGARDGGLSLAAGACCGTAEAGYHSAKYFKSGNEFFNSAIETVKSAKTSVFVEFYIIGRGHVYNTFFQALKAAKENGAEIKIILDGMGSAFRLGKKDFKKLKELGAEIKIFHKLLPLAHSKLNLRDHRKLIVIDGKTAYTGGLNLADEYVNVNSPYGYWKDTGVAVSGSAAKIFEGMFLAMWHGSHEMPAPDRAESEKRVCLPFYDSPPRRSFYEDALICALSSAKERVHIFTPYFCLSDKTAAALAFTARRGVDVKVIIPHVPDKKYAFEVSKAFAHTMKYSGVKIYEYTPGFMHAKSVICDDKVFIGSYNFDFRSTHFNYEAGVVFGDDIAVCVERDFQECLALSAEATHGKLSHAKRMHRFLLRFFSPLI